MINNILKTGTEEYVELFDGGDTECSLNATIIDGDILYIVEDNGSIQEYSDYILSLNEYIKTCFKKKNGVETSTL